MNGKAITVQGLSFNYGRSRILEDVDASFSKGVFSVLLGRNGSGKSTLFNLMAGLETYKHGSIKLFGKEKKELSFAQCARLIGFLSQFHKTVFSFRVRDVVLTGRAAFSTFSPSKSDIKLVEESIEEMGISHLIDRPYTELSGGEQQLVMIARVLVQDPPLIMLDEPTNHLDIYYQTYVMQKLRELSKKGKTIIAIMHDPNMAMLYADEYHYMKNKKVISRDLGESQNQGEFLNRIYDVPFFSVQIQGKTIVMPKQPEL